MNFLKRLFTDESDAPGAPPFLDAVFFNDLQDALIGTERRLTVVGVDADFTVPNVAPDPLKAGRFGVATDVPRIYRDTGAAWELRAGLQWADLIGKPSTFPATWAGITGKPTLFPPAAHGHLAGDLPAATTGEAGIAELATPTELTDGVAGVLIPTAETLKAWLDARLTPEAWTNATLLNSWVAFGTPFDDLAGFYKDPLGRVHLRGVIKSGAIVNGTVLFTLPAGYRPTGQKVFGVSHHAGTSARLDVTTTGNVQLGQAASGNAYLSLDGVSFRAA